MPTDLSAEHTPDAIGARLAAATSHSYLRDFVFGAIDGGVTTFAVVCGVAGAQLSSGVAVILGLANLLGDGFSMAMGNYLSTKTDHEVVQHARDVERRHIELIPEGEREEVRQIFAAKGFSGDVLERIVDVITKNERQWIDTMLTDELGLRLDSPSPIRAAVATFAAFCLAGAVPLVPFAVFSAHDRAWLFTLSAIATALVFAITGMLKGYVLQQNRWRAAGETLLVGGGAALVAYLVGVALRWVGVEA
ncbi:MAG: VIT1/CCC1 transporter family protein [Pirellulales bacterium]|nr:VIT1/CCC1 transporter family protein [Pirellulales bacterium]